MSTTKQQKTESFDFYSVLPPAASSVGGQGKLDFRSRYGFHITPFTREIAVNHRFRLPHLDEALHALFEAVDGRQSAGMVAPAGSGKTNLIRALANQLPKARYLVRYVKTTSLSRRDMCREISTIMGAKSAGSLASLVRSLEERMLSVTDNESLRPVLILDDAHEMKPETLGLLKLVTNFEMDSRLVLSVLLVGQPPLRQLLQRPELEDVTRRLAHFAELPLLSKSDTKKYIQHRCKVAGASRVPFDEPALEAIYEVSRGNLRAIDRLSLKALTIAAKEEREQVELPHIMEARKQLWP